MEAGGFALHCANIRELARQMLMMRVARGFSMPYRDGCPGHNWLAGFLKRHPGNFDFMNSFGSAVMCCFQLFFSMTEATVPSCRALLRKVQSVQNAAARLLTSARRCDHITPLLRQLHWLPVQRRV